MSSSDVGVRPDQPSGTQGRRVHFALAVVALAMGGFAIGTAEFVVMGLLPQIAHGVSVSIPRGGHVISAYALGVVIGAPVISAIGARFPRRAMLVCLMATFAVANLLSALAASFEWLTLSRVFAGLPHGAYFGVASLVAARLATPALKGRAVAMVMIGLSVANVVGVPAATWLGQSLGWRTAFWIVSALAVLTIVLVMAYVPWTPGDPAASGRRELRVFTVPQVWFTLAAGAVGFGGMFSVLSYIAPTVTRVGGLPDSAVPIFLLSFGLGMVFGTWVGGEVARWSVLRSLFGATLALTALLLVFYVLAPYGWWALPLPFLISTTASVMVINLQLRLMDVAGDAQTLGAALNHSSLNIANALGAWLGGIAIAAGGGYRAPALVSAALAFAGFLVVCASVAHVRMTRKAHF